MSMSAATLLAIELALKCSPNNDKHYRRKALTERGATFQKGNRIWKLNNKLISEEMAMLGPLEALVNFIKEAV